MLKVYKNVHTTTKSLQQTDKQTENNNNNKEETVFVGLDGLCGKLETYLRYIHIHPPNPPVRVCDRHTAQSATYMPSSNKVHDMTYLAQYLHTVLVST